MYGNLEIMMMIKQEEIKKMQQEAEYLRLIRKMGRSNTKTNKGLWQIPLARIGSILTFIGYAFLKSGTTLKTRFSPNQPQFVQEDC